MTLIVRPVASKPRKAAMVQIGMPMMLANRGFYIAGILCDKTHFHAGRPQEVRVELLDSVEHCVLDVDHVGAHFAVHPEEQDGLAIRKRKAVDFEVVELDLGDVRQADGGIPSPVDDQFPQLVEILETTNGAQQVTALAGIDLAAGHVLVTSANRVADSRDREFAIGESRGIQEDADLPFSAAAYPHFGDTRHVRQACAYVVFHEVAHHVHVELPRVARQRRYIEKHEGI
jgi:hypothetical protein